jgi:putative transposon-encoded protein
MSISVKIEKITGILHEDLHVYLRKKVTRWGIPKRGLPGQSQKSTVII